MTVTKQVSLHGKRAFLTKEDILVGRGGIAAGGDDKPTIRRLEAPGRAAVGAVVEAVDSEVDDGERHLTNLDNHEIIRHESSKP